MKNTNDTGYVSAVTTEGTIEKDTRSQSLKKAFDESIDYNWSFHKAPDENECSIVVLDPKGWNPILTKTDKFLAEHICKTHNDWLKFKQKSGEKKVKKGNLRRLKNLAWRMKTFKKAFKVIEKNNYLGFDSIRIWIEQNEGDVNQWIFTKWLKNSSNYADFMWYFNDKNESYFNGSTSDEYEDMQDSLVFIDYFDLTTSTRTVVGILEEEWDPYTLHDEYESKLFADGKNFTAALVLEKMFEFAEEYVKHTGWITAEMAGKYHIDQHLVDFDGNSDVLLDKMDPDTANRVRKIVEGSDNKLLEKNPESNGEDENFKKPLEQRVDNLEKMVKDIWENVCADKSPVEVEDDLPKEIINKKPVLDGQECPRCKNSKNGCEFYDKGTCRGIVYPTYPPQYDPCVFER